MSRLFDLDELVKNSGLPKARVRALLKEMKREFPDDKLLWELHVVRAIMHEKALQRQQLTAQA